MYPSCPINIFAGHISTNLSHNIYNLRIKNGGKLYTNEFVYRGLSTKQGNNIYKKPPLRRRAVLCAQEDLKHITHLVYKITYYCQVFLHTSLINLLPLAYSNICHYSENALFYGIFSTAYLLIPAVSAELHTYIY